MAVQPGKFFIHKSPVQLNSLKRVFPNRNYRAFYRFFGFMFFFLGCSLIFLPWQQSATGTGKVVAYAPNDRQQEINAPIEGRIQKWHVFEGTKVKQGDPIVDLTDNDPEILNRLRAERDALAKRVMAAEAAVKTARINIERQGILFEKGLSAKRSIEQANLEYTRYLVDEANASVELARIDVRLARQMTQSVRAPVDGTILRVIAGQGAQIVKSGQMLAVLVPDTVSRAVEVWIDGNDMPLIRDGAHVRLQFEGWPALQFSGWPGAAFGTYGGKVALIDASDNGLGKFRVVITPTGEEWPSPDFLRQGVRAMAWVLLDEVSLGYELWRKFNGFPPNLPAVAKSSDKK